MTRTTNARIAGVTFLVYIAAGASGMAVAPGLLGHVVLSLIMFFSALVLGVTLYAITREEDPHIAMLGFTCRVGEGVIGVAGLLPIALAMQSLGTSAGEGSDAAAAQAVGAIFAKARGFNFLLSATSFAVGSTAFCWLLLRGRMIPIALAWLGVLSSALLVVMLPLQMGGALRGPLTMAMWLPMAMFEVILAGWLIVKGVALPARKA